jgi:hypothetical protein
MTLDPWFIPHAFALRNHPKLTTKLPTEKQLEHGDRR